ncbi:MAG: sugar transferase [Gemmatimonadaceae bacterium]
MSRFMPGGTQDGGGAQSRPSRAVRAHPHGRARSLAPLELVRGDPPAPPGPTRPRRLSNFLKRAIDVAGAAALLVLLAPAFLLIAVAIRADSPGPAFFVHRRLGRGGRHFGCLKFRTMVRDAESRVFRDAALRQQYVRSHFKIAAELDPRITRVGRFLRRSSLDELPQLWNVLLGHMSLVGPRPIVALEATHYGADLDALLSVRPGITGSWAVAGRSEVGYPARAQLELRYIRERSLAGDLLILLKTPWTVLTRRGAV